MDEGTWSTVLGTFRKAPSLVGANVVTDIKFDYVAQSTNQFSFIHINKRLLALGNVISALGDDKLIRFW